MIPRYGLAIMGLLVAEGAHRVSKPILCLDFDGVIHGYESGWKGASVIPDKPVPGCGLALLRFVQHFTVAIYSSRSRSLRGRMAMRRYVRELLWDACLSDSPEMERAWHATQGKPPEWIPWTAYDVRDVADHIGSKIRWPWFKPAALMTIDDRALTFNGDWSSPEYHPDAIRGFRPWNKRSASISSGGTLDESRNAGQTLSTQTG